MIDCQIREAPIRERCLEVRMAARNRSFTGGSFLGTLPKFTNALTCTYGQQFKGLAAMVTKRSDEFGFAVAHERRSPTCRGSATTILRWDMARLTSGLITRSAFPALQKPLAQSRVAIITTAAPFQPDKGDQGQARPTTQRRNSTRSIPATRQ